MKDYIETIYETEEIKPYILNMIQAEEAKLFLPVSYVLNDENVICVHKTDNMIHIEDIEEFTASEAINLAEILLKKLKEGEKKYLFSDIYEIDTENLYTDTGFSDIKTYYKPAETGGSIYDKLMEFLIYMERKVSSDGMGYVMELENYINNNHMAYEPLKRYIYKMKKEIKNRNII